MKRISRPPYAIRTRRRAQRGVNAISLAASVVVALVIVVVVVFLLLRKPATPVVGVQANPSVSAGPTATPAPSTPPPTEAPTATPTPTPPTTAAFVSLNAPQRIACNGQSTVHPHMTWSVVNATGITISIDLPGGLFDTYGTSGATDQQDDPVPFACSGSFKHTYYFATVGSVGPVSNRFVVITATP